MRILTTLSLLLLAATLPAQGVAGEFSPNPVAPGAQITFTGTDATGAGLNLPSPCGWYRIYQGTPTGPQVQLGIGCIQVIVPIAPNGNFSFMWDQRDASGAFVAPGLYWVETRVWDGAFGRMLIDWFCISIQPASDPSLTTSAAPRVGQTLAMTVASPNDPGAIYLTGLSLTSNSPVSVLGLQTCLSLPISGGITNGIGALNGSGSNSSLSVNVPSLPALAYFGFHVQAVIYDGAQFKLTNDLSLTIQP